MSLKSSQSKREKKPISRGNLYKFVDSKETTLDKEKKSQYEAAHAHVPHTFRPGIKGSITATAGMDKVEYMSHIKKSEEHEYFKDSSSAFPADRRFGGGTAKVFVDYNEDLQAARELHFKPIIRNKLQFDMSSSIEEIVLETDDEKRKRLKKEEADKMLNSAGMSYLKMKKMKKKGTNEATAEQRILDGGKQKSIESQFNHDIYKNILESNIRGEDLTTTLTKKINDTIMITKQNYDKTINDNLDLNNRGIFVNEYRKQYVQKQLYDTIIKMERRKDNINDFIGSRVISGKTALLFGDDDSIIDDNDLIDGFSDVQGNSSIIMDDPSITDTITSKGTYKFRRNRKKKTDDDIPPTTLQKTISHKEMVLRQMTPNAAMKRESVRRKVIPFSIKELSTSAVKQENNRREYEKEKKKKLIN
jgi:hypothetical protein